MSTFKEIIKSYCVQIPIIQRDYAQGRDNTKAISVRKQFLKDIKEVLQTNSTLHLDFVYGSMVERSQRKYFIPLDGQQRLTTLFLLYLYFGKKQEINIDYLKNFTYETRSSSRIFCKKLVENELNFSSKNLSDEIIDSSWFMFYWNNDPTIKSMLNMIDSIHSVFKNDEYFDQLDEITFDFFELDKYGLDDDLYVKMNARGKPLTDFENFKASFESFLGKQHPRYAKEFAQKIDNKWSDYFWVYAVKSEEFLIDDYFLNFFIYLTEMIHYSNSDQEFPSEPDFTFIESLYLNESNIQLLFKTLDNLDAISNLEKKIFSTNEYEQGKVHLFDSDIRLLNKLINNQPINLQQRILLFLVIKNNHLNTKHDDLVDLIRVSRNLLNRIRHRKTGAIIYTSDLVKKQVHYILKSFNISSNDNIYNLLNSKSVTTNLTGIPAGALQDEVNKANYINADINIKESIFELEDISFLKGSVSNFVSNDFSKNKIVLKAINKIFTYDTTLIIRSLLTIGDYRINIGWTNLGHKYYLGKKGFWEVVLTRPEQSAFFGDYLESYIKNGYSLQKMIDSYLNKVQSKGWRYYFIKYAEMTEKNTYLSKDNNVYAWDSDYKLEKMGGSNLNAYHINPYIYLLYRKSSKSVWSQQSDDMSYLYFDSFKIYSIDKGWKVVDTKKRDITSLQNNFVLNVENSYFWIDCRDDDRIVIGLDLISELEKL